MTNNIYLFKWRWRLYSLLHTSSNSNRRRRTSSLLLRSIMPVDGAQLYTLRCFFNHFTALEGFFFFFSFLAPFLFHLTQSSHLNANVAHIHMNWTRREESHESSSAALASLYSVKHLELLPLDCLLTSRLQLYINNKTLTLSSPLFFFHILSSLSLDTHTHTHTHTQNHKVTDYERVSCHFHLLNKSDSSLCGLFGPDGGTN